MSRALALLVGLAGLAGVSGRAAPAPTIAQSAPGRFEIAALNAKDAESVAAQAEECPVLFECL